jgi:hypothetical protein
MPNTTDELTAPQNSYAALMPGICIPNQPPPVGVSPKSNADEMTAPTTKAMKILIFMFMPFGRATSFGVQLPS